MLITLKNTKTNRINLHRIDEAVPAGGSVSLNLSWSLANDNKRSFLVTFDVSVKSEESYAMDISYEAIFECDNDIDDAFKIGLFPVVNAPAIAYPFLRSLISTITLNSGYRPIIIPTINFKALHDQKTNSINKQAINLPA